MIHAHIALDTGRTMIYTPDLLPHSDAPVHTSHLTPTQLADYRTTPRALTPHEQRCIDDGIRAGLSPARLIRDLHVDREAVTIRGELMGLAWDQHAKQWADTEPEDAPKSDKHHHQGWSAADRARAMAMVHMGFTHLVTSRATGIPASTISNWAIEERQTPAKNCAGGE